MKPEWMPLDAAGFSARYGQRLVVIVPYRDRLEHLRAFIAHMARYFAADKLDRAIDWRILVVEQDGQERFNRGKLLNVGFDLVRANADYVVFHDVDYLPIWADYGFAARPARLIWDGLTYLEDRDRFFGAVTAFSMADFTAVNGYSNGYWGWGMEDVELRARCDIAGLAVEHRDGTYRSLRHESAGLTPSGPSPEAQATRARYRQRAADLPRLMRTDGLTSLSYRLLARHTPVRVEGTDYDRVSLARVDIGRPDDGNPDAAPAL